MSQFTTSKTKTHVDVFRPVLLSCIINLGQSGQCTFELQQLHVSLGNIEIGCAATATPFNADSQSSQQSIIKVLMLFFCESSQLPMRYTSNYGDCNFLLTVSGAITIRQYWHVDVLRHGLSSCMTDLGKIGQYTLKLQQLPFMAHLRY